MKYIYCDVIPEGRTTSLYYIADFPVKKGDIVVVSLNVRGTETLKVGTVSGIRTYSEDNAPFPVSNTKHILHLYSEDDEKNKDLALQHRNIRRKEEQKHKLDIKNNITNSSAYRVYAENSRKQMQMALRQYEKGDIYRFPCEVGGITLSEDGKAVVEYNSTRNRFGRVVIIPDGVERIENGAFKGAQIRSLYINKELSFIGDDTLFYFGCNSTNIDYIEVDKDNEKYSADSVGLYEILNGGGKRLVSIYKKDITEYITPDGVSEFGKDAFECCGSLKSIIVGKDVRRFNESSLSEHTRLSVYISKNVSDIECVPRCKNEYIIDDENECLFTDNNCVYRVLSDGEYKLLSFIGKVADDSTILDGTSEIGDYAFYGCRGFERIHFPSSVKIIGKGAFRSTELKELIIPDTVKEIRAEAFSICNELKKVFIDHELDYIEENAFSHCPYLSSICSRSGKSLYQFSSGKIYSRTKPRIAPPSDPIKEIADTLFDSVYDTNSGTITLKLDVQQFGDDDALVKERIACAEQLSVGDEVAIRLSDSGEVTSLQGQPLGKVGDYYFNKIVEHFDLIEISSVRIAKITPKSRRKNNAKYALVSVEITLMPIDHSKLSAEDKKIRSKFAYHIDGNEAHLTKLLDDSVRKLTIPAYIEGKRVRILPSGWLDGFPQIEELIISEGIERLEDGSLFGLECIKKIVFPASVTYISPDVFSDDGYRNLFLEADTVFIAPKSSYAENFLINYTPDEDAPDEDEYKFKLTVINNEKSLTREFKYIKFDRCEGGYAAGFLDRDKVEDDIVAVPEICDGSPVVSLCMKTIPSNVKKLIIPASVKELPGLDYDYLFTSRNYRALESIEISEDNTTYWSDGFAVYSKDKKRLIRMLINTQTEYAVCSQTEVLEEKAFYDMEYLECVKLPPRLCKIKNYAFGGCKSLKKIENFENVAEVDNKIFSLTGYKDELKPECPDAPFFNNSPLLIVGKTLLKYTADDEKYSIPNGIENIYAYAFSCKNRKNRLKEVIMPDSVKEIGAFAFENCASLEKVILSDSLGVLPVGLFNGCAKLKHLDIPASMQKIDVSVYSNNSGNTMESIRVSPENQNYYSENGMLFSKDKIILYFVPSKMDLSKTPVPPEVTIIADYAANGNKTEMLILPENITEIGEHAFEKMPKLAALTLPDTLTEIKGFAFNECRELENIVWSRNLKTIGESAFCGTGISTLDLPETVEHIDKEAFAETRLTHVRLPRSVRTIGRSVFAGCKEIEIYDTIDPDCKGCDEAVDTLNGKLNSNVGLIGADYSQLIRGYAYKKYSYSITVLSAQTNEIKYAVWMGADDTQSEHIFLLTSAWGKNGTFSFKALDKLFPHIRDTVHKEKTAQLRLKYPVELSEEARGKYEKYLSTKGV